MIYFLPASRTKKRFGLWHIGRNLCYPLLPRNILKLGFDIHVVQHILQVNHQQKVHHVSESSRAEAISSALHEAVSYSLASNLFTRPAYRLGRHAMVPVMPARLHHAISGILAGRILGFGMTFLLWHPTAHLVIFVVLFLLCLHGWPARYLAHKLPCKHHPH